MIIRVLCILLLLIAPAAAQRAQPTPYDPMIIVYQLGLKTGQDVAAAMQAADDKLKWVLDNWVPKQPENNK